MFEIIMYFNGIDIFVLSSRVYLSYATPCETHRPAVMFTTAFKSTILVPNTPLTWTV